MADSIPAPSLDTCIQELHAAIKPLRGLLGIAEILERARDAERFLAGSQQQLADLAAAEAAARQATAEAAAEARELRAEAQAQLTAAQDALEDARRQAAAIIAEAKAQGQRELAATRAEALQVQTARLDDEERSQRAKAELEQTQATLSHLNAQVIDAQAVIAKAAAIKRMMSGG